MSEQAAKLLKEAIELSPHDCKYIFPNKTFETPYSEPIQRNWLNYLREQAGFKAIRKAARATFISIDRSLSIEPLVIKRLSSHTAAGSGDVTDGYTTSEQQTMRDLLSN